MKNVLKQIWEELKVTKYLRESMYEYCTIPEMVHKRARNIPRKSAKVRTFLAKGSRKQKRGKTKKPFFALKILGTFYGNREHECQMTFFCFLDTNVLYCSSGMISSYCIYFYFLRQT